MREIYPPLESPRSFAEAMIVSVRADETGARSLEQFRAVTQRFPGRVPIMIRIVCTDGRVDFTRFLVGRGRRTPPQVHNEKVAGRALRNRECTRMAANGRVWYTQCPTSTTNDTAPVGLTTPWAKRHGAAAAAYSTVHG